MMLGNYTGTSAVSHSVRGGGGVGGGGKLQSEERLEFRASVAKLQTSVFRSHKANLIAGPWQTCT